jgi:hypothetical protein
VLKKFTAVHKFRVQVLQVYKIKKVYRCIACIAKFKVPFNKPVVIKDRANKHGISRGEQSAWLAAIAPYNAGEPATPSKHSEKTLRKDKYHAKTKYSHRFSGNRKGA